MAKRMKSSTLRCSLGSIHRSALKLPSEPSPRGIWPAILQGRSETSKFSMRAIPLSPARSRCHVGSTPQASGVTMPRPVTTTRLIDQRSGRSLGQDSGPTPSRRNLPPRRVLAIAAYRSHACACHPCCVAALASGSALRVFFEELDRVAHGENGFGGVVGNLAAKLFLEGHDQLYRVEAVGAEIVDETGVFCNFVGLNTEMLNDDLLHPLANIAHRFQPLLSTRPDQ